MSGPISRRGFIGAVTTIAGALAGAAVAAEIPKDTGLSSEGLLVGRPGFQPRTVMPLPHDAIPGFLSHEQLATHHSDYRALVARLADAERQLQTGTAAADRYVELRHAQVAAANAVLLHEFYFRNLAATKVEMSRYIAGHLREHIGSIETWVADFTRCALAAKAWAVLAYDPYDDRWHNVILDGDDAGMWIGANPLVVCDVSEHAYRKDFARREDYVAAFLDHLDWDEVGQRYKAVDRM